MAINFADQLVITRQAIEEQRRKAEEEYQKNLDALERVARLIPPNGALEKIQLPDIPVKRTADSGDEPSSDSETLIGTVLETVLSRPTVALSPRMVFNILVNQNFPFAGDERRSLISIGSALRKLTERDNPQIRLSRRGSGRKPNLYRAVRGEGQNAGALAGSREMTM
jgi:hypothetical protein